ncbi:aspartate aminotransferase [candidate division WWE3 bacterium RIFOXYC1_FULL_39_7]|uniref:Aminotransferase n=2 Tax=Katanobacteria TaxID=422282 RepID=A0A1F4X6Q0_UNCKA|nr:MAG: aspartate aminotransferase [candidate division WWE3 bacterium RIFOXYC1_FULL_39_7]OGC77332.1 MAG: aspartate aminotransferase [candidate division WWE3 bacterium RIFOXYD1_FULL_39_9]
MKLADRTLNLNAEGAYAVLSKAQELERQGKKIIHLEIGQPDFPTPGNVSKAGITAIEEGRTKYNPPLGVFELRQEIAKQFSKSRNCEVYASQVVITPSGKMGIFAAYSAIVNPGDEVIYPDPGFPTYEALTDFFGGVKTPVPMTEENDFSFDMEIFKKTINKNTKLIILNSPSNPTGSIISKKDLIEIGKLAEENNSWIVSDEMYSRILYDGEFNSIYSEHGNEGRTIILDGFSKTYSMTGWRLGYMIVPVDFVKKFDYILTHSVGCTATFTQYAGLEALRGDQTSVSRMVSEFKKRRDYLVAALNEIKGVTCKLPAGAFYVFPNIKSFGKSSDEIADYLLNEANVALLSGKSFGAHGEGYLRISYATSMENLEEGVKRIKTALAKL